MDNELKMLLCEQSGGIMMSDELFKRFMGAMTEIHLKDREILIPYGKHDTNLYVQRNGVLRACYFDGEKEKTYGFSGQGSIPLSYHAYYAGQGSVFQIESCGETDVLRMPQKDMDKLLDDSHEFARWMGAVHATQCYYNEYKYVYITGSVKERYLSLIKKRPEILARVPLKIIASYLGVEPNYLSYLKNQEWREK
jgi:hypothetical protein